MPTTTLIDTNDIVIGGTGTTTTHTVSITPSGKESAGYVILLTVVWTTSNSRTLNSITGSNITWVAATPRYAPASAGVYVQVWMGVVGPGYASGAISSTMTFSGTISGASSSMFAYYNEFQTDHPSPDWTVSQQGIGTTAASSSVQTSAMTGANTGDFFLGTNPVLSATSSGAIINEQSWITYEPDDAYGWFGDVPGNIGGSIPATGFTGTGSGSTGRWVCITALLSPGAPLPTIEPGRYHQSAAA